MAYTKEQAKLEREIRPTALDLAAGIGPVALALITMQHEKGKQP